VLLCIAGRGRKTGPGIEELNPGGLFAEIADKLRGTGGMVFSFR